MKVTFEPAASDELDRIFDWIDRDNPRAALNMIARIEDKVMRLESPELTHMGRPGLAKVRASFSNGHISLSTRSTKTVRKSSSCPSFTARRIAKARGRNAEALTRGLFGSNIAG